MNELLDDLSPEDGAVIARVRAALDEVTAHDHDHDHDQAHSLVPAEWPRSGVGAGRWLAIAAAAGPVPSGLAILQHAAVATAGLSLVIFFVTAFPGTAGGFKTDG